MDRRDSCYLDRLQIFSLRVIEFDMDCNVLMNVCRMHPMLGYNS